MAPKSYEPRSINDVFEASSPASLRLKQLHYDDNEIISSESLNPPPVANLLCVYGTNIETEVCQFYKR